MKYLFLLLFFAGSLHAAPQRFEIDVVDGKLIYYAEAPVETAPHAFMIALEGSYVDEIGPQGVLRLHKKLADPFLKTGVGLITMERWGIDGVLLDKNSFHSNNTPSKRLQDHILLVEHLRAHPPVNWNGQLFILGGSEGGPIAIRLSYAVSPTACIAIVGCSDQPFKNLIWETILAIKAQGYSFDEMPEDRAAFDAICARFKDDPDPSKMWFGQTYLYWADALDLTEHVEFLGLQCPALVVAGSLDMECLSTDRLIAAAKSKRQDVTYLRIEGMGHNALDPQWHVIEHIQEFVLRLCQSPLEPAI